MREVWACGVNFWKKERVFRVKLKERAEAAPSRYCATGNFSQYIFSVLVAKNYQKIRSRCLVHEFPFTDVFRNISHGNWAAILKKNYLWLLPFYMATYCYYEMVHRTMHTAIVSYLFKLSRKAWCKSGTRTPGPGTSRP